MSFSKIDHNTISQQVGKRKLSPEVFPSAELSLENPQQIVRTSDTPENLCNNATMTKIWKAETVS